METKYLTIALLWAAYCALHSYLISITFTNVTIRILKDYYAFFRVFYILISLVLLIPLINITAHAFILWLIGIPLYTGSVYSVFLSVPFIVNILYWRHLEEQELLARFSDYREYRKTTLF
jgi:protein-S-isoprenylcysteine O-methyltransferase Ste14